MTGRTPDRSHDAPAPVPVMTEQDRATPRRGTELHVDGIVLAAGRSTRMGRPKALIRVRGESFVERAVRVLQEGGCRGVIVVVSDAAGEVADLAEMAGARTVVNEEGGEPIDSIRLAIDTLPDDVDWAMILPVDHPLVEPRTVMLLIEAARTRGSPIVRPVHGGVPGHPGLFARRTFDDFSRPGLEKGAHSVVESYGDAVLDLPVDDPGVTADLNTPEELNRWLGDGIS